MAFGYAGVHQLLFPLASAVDALPDPQRLALQTVLGVVQQVPPDPYLVGLAVLTLLADEALAQPILIVIDDAQWLDDESVTVLSFVARRLLADRVALVVATRTETGSGASFEGIHRLDLTGLAPGDALQVLTSATGTPIHSRNDLPAEVGAAVRSAAPPGRRSTRVRR
ncbi:MAG: hypothetical protein QOJ19_478 [Acidimicrobiia bacterium]|nr:hypothetical protein [Acidimicrobiia bacterium]